MHNQLQDAPSRHRVESNSSQGFKNRLDSAVKHGVFYLKLTLGILLVVLMVLFVAQNADAIHVKFLIWETEISQALVIFLTLLSGVVIGAMANRWQRWRLSHGARDS